MPDDEINKMVSDATAGIRKEDHDELKRRGEFDKVKKAVRSGDKGSVKKALEDLGDAHNAVNSERHSRLGRILYGKKRG